MRKLIFAVVMAAGATAFAAETGGAEKTQYVDPNPYARYNDAMVSTEEDPLAVNWSRAHDAEIAAATGESVLAACVESEESAAALLAKLGPAYETDPLTMIQIAAVTQWVMLPDPCFLFFWEPSPSAGRKVWTGALARKIAESKDDYIRTFCRQQLDLCEVKAGK